ncbi:hypothetical protein BDD12DRAFT_937273 [Trichophaea hybrida]|nr:hypothetical protein BDD12DRAFT_937273 [Trichophaea hybrida]
MLPWISRRKKKSQEPTPPHSSGADVDVSAPSSQPAPRKIFPSGLRVLHQPECVIADILFVHGLTGDRERTWTAPGSSAPWPQTLLPEKLSKTPARILTFGYDANVVDLKSIVSKNRIGNHSKNLLTALATHREDDGTTTRPIIFVVHSLGGLVCADTLLASRNSAEPHLQNILECTYGILFLGTPHSGSGLARWAELLAKSIGIIKQTNPQILEVLKNDSEVLARIQSDFHTMLRARANAGAREIPTTCYYEELPLPGIGEVVPMHSAILPAYPSIGIRKNHSDMTKFHSEEDPGFISIVGELRRWVRAITPAPATTAHEQTTIKNAPVDQVNDESPSSVPQNVETVPGGSTHHHGNNAEGAIAMYGNQSFWGPIHFGV